MTRKQALILMLGTALPVISAAAPPIKRHIRFTDYLNGQHGIQHVNGPGDYSFDDGGTLQLVVTNSVTLVKSLRIKNLPNGEHLLLRHLKDNLFEVVHEGTGQKASLRLALEK
jgi:hypothetical protein